LKTLLALQHRTRYAFDRPVTLAPHLIRLHPAPHCRTSIRAYALNVRPQEHLLYWQQDATPNRIARLVFSSQARELAITVDMGVEIDDTNPFDFLVDPYAASFPFAYPPVLQRELSTFLTIDERGPGLLEWIRAFRKDNADGALSTTDFLVELNRRLNGDVVHVLRMEAGVQTPDQTLQAGNGSCRDSGWLLVQILRHCAIAARFVSGYLIQLDIDGGAGTNRDSLGLHAWAEAFVPGAGWIGLDPTSGLLTGQRHIPLATGALPETTAPVDGTTSQAEVELSFDMSVTRLPQ